MGTLVGGNSVINNYGRIKDNKKGINKDGGFSNQVALVIMLTLYPLGICFSAIVTTLLWPVVEDNFVSPGVKESLYLDHKVGRSEYAQFSPKCREAVASVELDIESRLGGKIAYTNYTSNTLEKSPTDRTDRINVQLGLDYKMNGPPLAKSQLQSNSHIVGSKALMKKYAEKIVSQCRTVGQVEIGLYQSDAETIYSYHPNGSIKEDECLISYEHPRLDSRHLRWGSRICY